MKVIKHWESSAKSKRSASKSYETLQKHHNDLLIPAKLQFFAFVAAIFEPCLTIFQTDIPMIPFMFEELERIYNKLLRLVIRSDSLEETQSITKRLKKEWLENKANHLENGLVDTVAATKLKLRDTKVRVETKRNFMGECKKFIINILVKISERFPMQFSIVRNALSLNPINMVRHPEESLQMFTKLADRLFALQKITASVADKSKNQYDDLLETARFERKDKFLNSKMKSDRLDEFFGNLLLGKSHAELLSLCQIVFVLSHGQSFTERSFSINREVLDVNMQEKSLTSQKIVYDTLQDSDQKIHEINITQDLRKHCRLAYQKCKTEMERITNENKQTEQIIKRKLKLDEIESVKKQKLNIESCIDNLKEGIINETLAVDQNQDLIATARAASFCRAMQEKQTTLKEINSTLEKLEDEYKKL